MNGGDARSFLGRCPNGHVIQAWLRSDMPNGAVPASTAIRCIDCGEPVVVSR